MEVLEVVARANYIGHRRVGRAVARFQQRRPRRDRVDRAEPRRDRLGHGPDGRAELDLGRRERRARLRDVERAGFVVGAAGGQRSAHRTVRERGLRRLGRIDALMRRAQHRVVESVEARHFNGDQTVFSQILLAVQVANLELCRIKRRRCARFAGIFAQRGSAMNGEGCNKNCAYVLHPHCDRAL